MATRAAVWAAFVAVHGWLTYLGVVVLPGAAFHDVDLYRWWMHLGLHEGRWPVLDEPSVYPAAAVLPMLLPALVAATTPGYALAWCGLVTLLDAFAVAALLRAGGRRGEAAAWWWLAFLLLLGPVGIGRLDAVVAPLTIVALLLAAAPTTTRTRGAAALLTLGAWVKVAPGALVLPLAAAARRPVRDVVAPAAAVCAVVVGAVAAGGGLPRLLGFLDAQGERGLQVESVAATVVGALHRDDVAVVLNEELVTYEVVGPGTAGAAAVLDVLLPLAVGAVALVLLAARRRGTAPAALLPASLLLVALLVVTNKVGSPQFLTWFAPPVAVLVAMRAPTTWRDVRPVWWQVAGALVLLAAGLTQAVFPWGYLPLLAGDDGMALILDARNALLLAVTACAVVGLARAVRGPTTADA
ncbi:hypothetical protein [Actinotalea sp. JY-7876]|uniref:hypothetical protein n=1 Tax=Actinotalea sp. JY-7876 TaxID=2758442 RepID=UPI0015F699AE|nr:hypothetical protein [Actinotalea sp. JY-7876]